MTKHNNSRPAGPDAILVMRGTVPDLRSDRHAEYRRRFGDLMDPIVEDEQMGPGRYLLTTTGGQTLYYPHGHPLAGRPRYTWEEAGPGVRFGRLATY